MAEPEPRDLAALMAAIRRHVSASLVIVAVFLAGGIVLHLTRFGTNVYALGGSRVSTGLMGITVGRHTVAIYALSSFLAGLSGIVMGYRLTQAGIPFLIVEKNDGPGGTWFENRYPGARVDVPSACYSFSFSRDFAWPELFSPAPVLRRYFAEMVERLGLAEHIRYRTDVTRAVYDEAAAQWAVSLRSADGEENTRVRALVSAVGQLNRPLIPRIELAPLTSSDE